MMKREGGGRGGKGREGKGMRGAGLLDGQNGRTLRICGCFFLLWPPRRSMDTDRTGLPDEVDKRQKAPFCGYF